MIYWLVSTLWRRTWPWIAALVAEAIAVAVEFLKLVHTPALDTFRGTLAGILLLGREFSYADIVAYTLAIGGAASADIWMRGRIAIA